jgi:hypothetical protein
MVADTSLCVCVCVCLQMLTDLFVDGLIYTKVSRYFTYTRILIPHTQVHIHMLMILFYNDLWSASHFLTHVHVCNVLCVLCT